MTPDLAAATKALDFALETFQAATEGFLAAGGDPAVVMQKFQSAVLG